MKRVIFGAGRAWDTTGNPTSFWTGVVTYAWNPKKKVFFLYTSETLGTGSVVNFHTQVQEVKSCEEVNSFLDYLKELENYYKKVYE